MVPQKHNIFIIKINYHQNQFHNWLRMFQDYHIIINFCNFDLRTEHGELVMKPAPATQSPNNSNKTLKKTDFCYIFIKINHLLTIL